MKSNKFSWLLGVIDDLQHYGPPLKLHVDIEANASICWLMDPYSEDRIRTLYMHIGIIMEDTSMVALIWRDSDGLTPGDRLAKVKAANENIGVLISQLEAMVR